MESALAGLGRTGETPEHTIKTILLTHKTDDGNKMFEPFGDGDYGLVDPDSTKKIPEVKEALRRLNLNAR